MSNTPETLYERMREHLHIQFPATVGHIPLRDMLEQLDDIERERALADRLGNALEKIPWTFVGREEQASEEWNAIAAWKEARSE